MSSDAGPKLYAGERIHNVAGAPWLSRFFPAKPHQPLLVFIPGGAHNARVFYGGHAGHDSRDFVTEHLTNSGFGVLALSYPLETTPTILPPSVPGLRIDAWGQQAASITKQIIDEHKLCPEVVLVGWSMGGRILVPFSREARRLGLYVELFISLAATPGLPGARLGTPETTLTPAGYASLEGMAHMFVNQIRAQEERDGGKTVIPEQVYRAEYLGATPVSLLGWGLEYDGQGGTVKDEWRHIQDAAAHSFADLPWLACLEPTSQLDARHALADRATWGYLITQRLTNMLVSRPHLEPERWERLLDFVHDAPDNSCVSVPGNHFFFLGRSGAQATSTAIIQMVANSTCWQWDLDDLLAQR